MNIESSGMLITEKPKHLTSARALVYDRLTRESGEVVRGLKDILRLYTTGLALASEDLLREELRSSRMDQAEIYRFNRYSDLTRADLTTAQLMDRLRAEHRTLQAA